MSRDLHSDDFSLKERFFIAIALCAIFIIIIIDVIHDAQAGGSATHIGIEIFVALLAGFGLFILLRSSFQTKARLASTRKNLAQSQAEAAKWKAESEKHIQGLSVAIDAQLDRWELTQAEKEVALLLLKGLSLKEIAEVRSTSEKTARAQSTAVYQKSGLKGRSELSAFFLEDLLLPPSPQQ